MRYLYRMQISRLATAVALVLALSARVGGCATSPEPGLRERFSRSLSRAADDDEAPQEPALGACPVPP